MLGGRQGSGRALAHSAAGLSGGFGEAARTRPEVGGPSQGLLIGLCSLVGVVITSLHLLPRYPFSKPFEGRGRVSFFSSSQCPTWQVAQAMVRDVFGGWDCRRACRVPKTQGGGSALSRLLEIVTSPAWAWMGWEAEGMAWRADLRSRVLCGTCEAGAGQSWVCR